MSSLNKFYNNLFLHITLLVILLIYLWRNARVITIDTFRKIISFKNIFTNQTVEYSFNDFEGFVETIIPYGRRGRTSKGIGLIQDNWIIKKIDSYYYSNYQELTNALSNIKNLGKINLDFLKGIKLKYGHPIKFR